MTRAERIRTYTKQSADIRALHELQLDRETAHRRIDELTAELDQLADHLGLDDPALDDLPEGAAYGVHVRFDDDRLMLLGDWQRWRGGVTTDRLAAADHNRIFRATVKAPGETVPGGPTYRGIADYLGVSVGVSEFVPPGQAFLVNPSMRRVRPVD